MRRIKRGNGRGGRGGRGGRCGDGRGVDEGRRRIFSVDDGDVTGATKARS